MPLQFRSLARLLITNQTVYEKITNRAALGL